MGLTGQVGVVHHGRGFLPWLIESVTGSPAYHTVIAVSETVVMSAGMWNVKPEPISQFRNVTWTRYSLAPETVEAVVNAAWARVGVRYNIAAFLILGVQHVTGVRIPGCVAAWLNRRPYLTCSQMCSQIMAGVAGVQVPAAVVSCPCDWRQMLQQLGWM